MNSICKQKLLSRMVVAFFLASLLLTACGKKGDLYVPEEDAAVKSSAGSATQQDKDEKQKKQPQSPAE